MPLSDLLGARRTTTPKRDTAPPPLADAYTPLSPSATAGLAAPPLPEAPQASGVPFAIGVKARDLVTGLEGILTARADLLQGSRQWAIQPPADPESKDVPKAVYTDEVSLETLDAGIRDRIPPRTPLAVFRLGEEVLDKMTGFQGFVAEQVQYQNGCVSYALVGRRLDRDGAPQVITVDCTRVERVGKGHTTPEIAAAPPERPPVSRTGTGPRAVGARTSAARTLDRR